MEKIKAAIQQRKVQVAVGIVACLVLVAALVFAAVSCQSSGVSGPGGCTMNAELMTDVTVPDGTQFAGGAGFTKTWRISNSGTCAWEEGTQLAYISGDPLGGPTAVNVPALTAGSSADVSVDFVAPTAAGTYRSDWRMKMPDGTQFGAGVHVQIVVAVAASGSLAPTPTPTTGPVATATLAPMPTPPPTPTPTPIGGGLGRIAWSSNRDGTFHIYSGTSDASLTRLTNTSSLDDKPDWSRDGGHITFERWLSGSPDIFSMKADGSAQTNLTHSSWYDTEPSWSPDGGNIVFSSNHGGGVLQIWTMKSDGSALTKLTFTTKLNDYPDWSPDGTRIAFESQRDGQDEIYIMNANGSGQTRLTSTGGNGFPKWSPDGSKILFHGTHGLWVMNAYGGSKTQLTTNSTDVRAAWSPDGKFIVFDSARSGNYDLWIMKADGTGITQLTTNSAMDTSPSWI